MPRLAVVTGAASGIGLASARRLRAGGVAVVGLDLAGPPADLADDAGVSWVRGDVAAEATWASAEEAWLARDQAGADCLVACAADLVVAPFLSTSPDEWRRLLDVNVIGAVRGMQAVLPGMVARGEGAIAVVCSVNSFVAENQMSAYSTTKAALLHATRSAAIEHAADGVRINAVCPGVVDTPLLRRHLESQEDPDVVLAAAVRRTPAGRLIAPDDVASAVCFLVSDAAAAMAGSALTVDGGLIATYEFDSSPGDAQLKA